MIAKVTRCWDSPPRLTVILQEKGATKETQAFLWSDSQVLQAQLALDCERKERYFAVQLAPPDRFGHHHIERFEMIHEPRDLKAETDALIAAHDHEDRSADRRYPSSAQIDIDRELAAGKRWHDI